MSNLKFKWLKIDCREPFFTYILPFFDYNNIMNYYGKSIIKIKEFLKKDGYISEEEWNKYKKGKAFLGSESIMWTYAETEDWKLFLSKLKKEIE